jgi:hypothetical protein
MELCCFYMSMAEKFPAQNGRAGVPENGAIPLDLDIERPTSSEGNIFYHVLAMFFSWHRRR